MTEHIDRRNLLTGLKPAKEDTTERLVMDTIAEGMLERGFSSLWSQPKRKDNVVFGDREKRIFLIKLATTGRRALAAAHAGVSGTTARKHAQFDPVFAAAIQEATDYFRDILVGEMYRRGVEGYEEDVIGGKQRDQIFKIRKYSDKMLTTLGQIHIKEMQKKEDAIVHETTKIINNTFDMESMPAEDLAVYKKLLQNQQKRVEDAEADAKAINGKVEPDE